jgi:hypothetical protein
LTFYNDEVVTLNGQTRVTLSREYHTVTRAYTANLTFVSPATEFVGDVRVYQFEAGDTVTNGVPANNDRVAALIQAVDQQTQIAATTISSTQFFVVDDIEAQIYEKSAGFIDVKLKVKELGGVWRTRNELSVPAAQGWNDKVFRRPLIVPPNSKLRLDALADSAGTECSAEIRGELYRIIDDAPGSV